MNKRLTPIAGLEPFSTVDWPQRIACCAFVAGCPLACPYCHNAKIHDRSLAATDTCELEHLLERRHGLIDGVVISGGEPLTYPDLERLIALVHAHGYPCALHTSGVAPRRLAGVAHELAWVGLDVKAPWSKYQAVCGRDIADRVKKSIAVLVEAGTPFEARTTWHTMLLDRSDIEEIARQLHAAGVKHWAVQRARAANGLPASTCREDDVPQEARDLFETFTFR